jgi:hypothetical protein
LKRGDVRWQIHSLAVVFLSQLKSMRLFLFTFALLVAPPILRAQTPAQPAPVVSAAQLRALGDSLANGRGRTIQLGGSAGLTWAVTHRDTIGGAETHMAWTDIFVVQRGAAALVTGGFIVGAKETTPGEWRGTVIQGGSSAALHPGDVVVIPAGTPHQMRLAARERITYLAFKVPATSPAPPAPRRP